jgi:hypothetical protein
MSPQEIQSLNIVPIAETSGAPGSPAPAAGAAAVAAYPAAKQPMLLGDNLGIKNFSPPFALAFAFDLASNLETCETLKP